MVWRGLIGSSFFFPGSCFQNGTLSASKSKFDDKIELSSAKMYFHYYGQLLHQQNMLQDYVRTGCISKLLFVGILAIHFLGLFIEVILEQIRIMRHCAGKMLCTLSSLLLVLEQIRIISYKLHEWLTWLAYLFQELIMLQSLRTELILSVVWLWTLVLVAVFCHYLLLRFHDFFVVVHENRLLKQMYMCYSSCRIDMHLFRLGSPSPSLSYIRLVPNMFMQWKHLKWQNMLENLLLETRSWVRELRWDFCSLFS